MTPPAGNDAPERLGRALAWMVVSGFCFALMAATVKLSGDVPLAAKVFFRNLVTLAVTAAVFAAQRRNPFGATPHLPLLVARSLCGLAGVAFYFLALQRLSLADASLLNKTSPFFVMVLAVPVLKEPFERAWLPVLAAAFLGALLVIRPGFQTELLPALAGLASGLFAGLAYVLVRALKGRAEPHRIIFVFSLVSCLATAPFLVARPPHPDGGQWLALAGTGLFAAGGQFGLTFAYHHARAGRVSVFTYLHVVFAMLLGLLLWDERPDTASLAGAALIIGAAVRAHALGRRDGARA